MYVCFLLPGLSKCPFVSCNVSIFIVRCRLLVKNQDHPTQQEHAGWRSGKSTRLHQWGLGLNPCVETICGLSLLLVLSLAPRGFSLGTAVFPSPQKPTLPNSNSILNARTRLNEFIRTPKCLVGKQITITITITIKNSLNIHAWIRG